VQGDFAYVGVGPRLAILDVSTPGHPNSAGETEPLPNVVHGVAVEGPHVYIADRDAGLRIVDVSNPGAPIEVGVYDTAGNCLDVAVSGGLAYLAAGGAGLNIVDIADVGAPGSVGSLDTPGTAWGVAVNGGYAYVADWGHGLRVIDVADPTAPVEVGFWDTPGAAVGVAVAGGYAYVADLDEGLRIIDISHPMAPAEVGAHEAWGLTWDVTVAGNHAYVADDHGLVVVDISDPAAPSEAGRCATLGEARGVVLAGIHAYVADESRGLVIVDVSDPEDPADVARIDGVGDARDLVLAGEYAYVADSDGGLRIVGISDPSSLWEVGSYDSPGVAYGVSVAGSYCYLADWGGDMRVVDVSDASTPVEVGLCDMPGSAEGVVVADGYAYIAAHTGGLRIVDVSDPKAPVEIGATEALTAVWDVAVMQQYAYVAAGHGDLVVVDVGDPTSPVTIADLEIPAWAIGVWLVGDYAYVGGSGEGLRIVDISDPRAPVEVGFYDTSRIHKVAAVVGDYAYVGEADNALRIVDIFDPGAPTEIGYYDTPGLPDGVAVANDLIFVAAQVAGVYVLRFVPPDLIVSHVEVTQAIQDKDNSVPLIADKPTFARVYVHTSAEHTSLPAVTGVLRGFGPSGELEGSRLMPVNPSITAYRETWQSQRGDLGKTLNFTLPEAWLTGTITLTAEVEHAGSLASRSQVAAFETVDPLRVGYVPIDYNHLGAPDAARVEGAYVYMEAVYPLHSVDYFHVVSVPFYWYGDETGGRWRLERGSALLYHLARLWLGYEIEGWPEPNGRPDHLFGWVSDGTWGLDGLGGRGGSVAYASDTPESRAYQVVMAHEIGHNLGRPDLFIENQGLHMPGDKCDLNDPGWPHDDDIDEQYDYRIHDTGFDFGFYQVNGVVDWETDDLMIGAHCEASEFDPKWVSAHTYRELANSLLGGGEEELEVRAAGSIEAGQAVLLLGGRVYTDTSAEIDAAYMLTATQTVSQAEGTDYCIELEASSGITLASSCFDLSFVDPEWGITLPVASFVRVVPYDPATVRVVLREGPNELAERTRSSHSPSVTVEFPDGGEVVSGTVDVGWSAGDDDGDLLEYMLSYSADLGQSWHHVALGITTTHMLVDMSRLPGSDGGLFRVVASDGMNSAIDVSDAPFSVPRHAPEAYILMPASGARLTPGEPMLLKGRGYDPEDGLLEAEALEWRSDLDGLLGTDTEVLATLSAGQHTITLTVTDSDGNVATADIDVFVGYRLYLPTLVRG
jgi:hypothetical protein